MAEADQNIHLSGLIINDFEGISNSSNVNESREVNEIMKTSLWPSLMGFHSTAFFEVPFLVSELNQVVEPSRWKRPNCHQMESYFMSEYDLRYLVTGDQKCIDDPNFNEFVV